MAAYCASTTTTTREARGLPDSTAFKRRERTGRSIPTSSWATPSSTRRRTSPSRIWNSRSLAICLPTQTPLTCSRIQSARTALSKLPLRSNSISTKTKKSANSHKRRIWSFPSRTSNHPTSTTHKPFSPKKIKIRTLQTYLSKTETQRLIKALLIYRCFQAKARTLS